MKWKKIAGGVFVIVLLAAAFWYGGNTPDNRGFAVSETAAVQQNRDRSKVESSDRKDTDTTVMRQETKNTKESSGNFFGQLFMKITHIGSSGSSPKAQGSKKAQRNAQKAVKTAEKRQKQTEASKKRTTGKASKNQETATTKDTESGKDNVTEQKDSQDDQKNDRKTDSEATRQNGDEITTENTQQNIESTESTTETSANVVSCTISITCSAVLDHMELLKDNKEKIIPKDGIILEKTTVTVKKGSNVFDVLQRVTKENKIQLEYNYTPAYKNYYIEGIGNLYEFDAGELSGWMYCVNDTFPGSGCSSYTVKDGDEIKWLYTCNLGKDVGGYFEEE